MGCKRSLYCWKNGPCASDEARKQIWEDNIKFRKSLKDLNQSDHYWSFQISKNLCICLEEEEFFRPIRRPLAKRFHTGSLQRLDDIHCTSVTHDCNGLKHRNCFVHCPSLGNSRCDIRAVDLPVPQATLSVKNIGAKEPLRPFRPLHKTNENKPEICSRYKNFLTNSNLQTQKKFSSQLNLANIDKRLGGSLQKKVAHGSCDNLSTGLKPIHSETSKNVQNTELHTDNKATDTQELDGIKDLGKQKKAQKELNPVVVPPGHENPRGLTPMSRTTRKMLQDSRQIPFVTFGCNNNNRDIGSKRTYNVLASKMEVYPSALSAKQQKRNLILKYMQSEKEFQNKCLQQNFNKGNVNHTSLWSIERNGKENKATQRKNTKNIFPVVSKPPKALGVHTTKLDSFPYKTYRKPQIYFY